MKKVLFVCLGNICRSPAAEGVFRSIVAEAGLALQFEIDSAGTNGLHDGESADPRMIRAARSRGYDLTSISRQVNPKSDFSRFDLILAMDRNNLNTLNQLDPKHIHKGKIKLLCDFRKAMNVTEVPDPYYGGAEGFEHVLDIIEDSAKGLLEHFTSRP